MRNLLFRLTIAASAMVVIICNPSKAGNNFKSVGSLPGFYSSIEAISKSADSLKEIINAYLQLKNSLTEDNSNGAAAAGKKLVAAFKNFDKSSLSAVQKKNIDDLVSDAVENAEHIGANGGRIEHQREHFVLLSKDIYDLVKTLGPGQVLYRDHDQMANEGKGAFWLSETKEIKNPYSGKAMLSRGTIVEEIK